MSQSLKPAAAETGEAPDPGAFRSIPYMGVIWVVTEAMKLGFTNGDPDWCNLGQGQPEVGDMPGAPPRISSIAIEPQDHAYGPVGGTDELREAIAAHYNRLYRDGHVSRYTADNISVAAGGRLVLTRAFSALGGGTLGYQVPDYTAYEDMINYHRHRFDTVALHADEADGFVLPPDRIGEAMAAEGLTALVLSNPCNPTGRVIRGDDLAAYLHHARKNDCTLLLDEFYSHFIYEGDQPAAGPVSAAAHVEDVDRDRVLLIDGLTKCFRYPGWRVGWAVGPRDMIETLNRAASAIDGGPGQPIQRGALAVLDPGRADGETTALREVFSTKRNLMARRLKAMGIRCAHEPDATFYAWATLADLPPPLNDADTFFRRALESRVLTVPGRFFDVNPGAVRQGPSPLSSWMRFSFGPPIDNVERGLDRLESMIRTAS